MTMDYETERSGYEGEYFYPCLSSFFIICSRPMFAMQKPFSSFISCLEHIADIFQTPVIIRPVMIVLLPLVEHAEIPLVVTGDAACPLGRGPEMIGKFILTP